MLIWPALAVAVSSLFAPPVRAGDGAATRFVPQVAVRAQAGAPAPHNDGADNLGERMPGAGTDAETCRALNAAEARLAQTLRSHPQQQRARLVCSDVLAHAARAKALDMAQRDYVGHVTPDGIGPNLWVVQAGYPLPNEYTPGPAANNVESLAAGAGSAEAAWAAWMEVETHRTHLLGLTPFFAAQESYGIGYVFVAGSRYGHYWVVLTAPSAWEAGGAATAASGSEDR